ncbi:MAG: TrmH family RNA methyltransferase [Acetanaerobacterium sp.]
MIITSVENPVVKLAVKLSSSKKERIQNGLFVIEGLRLCLDAVESGVKCRYVFITADAASKYYNSLKPVLAAGTTVYEVSESVFSKMSDTKSPQGVLCVCELLDKRMSLDTIDKSGFYVALERIQDPGNLGTIIRTAEAIGISGILISGDCCDIYSPKVIRATMGGVFRMPVYEADDIVCACARLNKMQLDTFAAVPDADAVGVTEAGFHTGSVVFVGNEGSGLSPELCAVCKTRITIRMAGRAESLNAAMAAGIIMWEMSRQRAVHSRLTASQQGARSAGKGERR